MKARSGFEYFFFSNTVGSLNISEYITNDPIYNVASNSIIKLILKYKKKHPSILTIGEVCKEKTDCFFFIRSR